MFLIMAPKLLEDKQLKLDILDKLKKSTAFSLFKKEGVPAAKLLGFNCFPSSALAEVKPPSPLLQKLRVGAACKDGAFFVKLGCTFLTDYLIVLIKADFCFAKIRLLNSFL